MRNTIRRIYNTKIHHGQGVFSLAGKSEYRNKWISENLDRVNLTMPKGRKLVVTEHAKLRGESVNAFINRAIAETIDRDNNTVEAERT